MNFVPGERADLIGGHLGQRTGRSVISDAFGFNSTAPSRKEKSQGDFVMQPKGCEVCQSGSDRATLG